MDEMRSYFSVATTRELLGHKKEVHSLGWNMGGTRLASGSVDQTARIWSLEHGKHSLELRGHTASVDQLAWDPTSPDRLATASADKSVRIWDVRAGANCVTTIHTSGENINLSWSPDGQHIAVGNKDDLLTIIDARKYKIIKTTKFLFEVNEMTWNNSGEYFFLTTGLGTVEVMRYPTLERVRTLSAHTANAYCIEFDPTGRYFAAGSADALVSLWDARELVCVRTFDRLEWPIRTLSFSHDGQLLASTSEDLMIDIAHVETGVQVHHITCRAAMNTVSWHPRMYILAYAGDEAFIKLFGFPSN
jgi:THO complex subunit 3